MAVGVVDGLEAVHIADDHGKVGLPLLVNGQNLLKRPAIQRIGQCVMLGLMTDELLRLLVFQVNFVVGYGQVLQLRRAHHRKDLPVLDAFAVQQQRLYD